MLIFPWNNFVQVQNEFNLPDNNSQLLSQAAKSNPYLVGYLVVQLNVMRLKFSFPSEKQSQLNTSIVDWLIEINVSFVYCALIQKLFTLMAYCTN